MDRAEARKILGGYQRELNREAASRIRGGVVDRPINLFKLPEDKQLALASEIKEIISEAERTGQIKIV
jgi:hypothetical protein